MLAQNFKSADELKISDAQKDALIKTLVLLETGKLIHAPESPGSHKRGEFTGHFNMDKWNSAEECGTAACIGGTAELIGNVSFSGLNHGLLPPQLYKLFYPNELEMDWGLITTEQAGRALRSYLTTGRANWREACA